MQLSPAEAAAELLRRRQARRSLLAFTKYTKPDYRAGRVHEYLAAKLEAFEQAIVAGEAPRLMLFLPPRTGKTELVLRFMAWCLGRHPDWPMLYASYAAEIAVEKSAEARAILASDAFAALFGRLATEDDPIELDPSSRAAQRWRIAGHRGGLMAVGVGGPLTGRGGRVLVWDDLVKNREEANSPVFRDKTWNWYTSTFRTRAEPGAGIVGIMTRWHEDDVAGRLQELANRDPQADQWDVVSLPALAESNDPLGRAEGEALDPGRFDREALLRTRASIGEADWYALYQQRPQPEGGAIFRREWWDGVNRFDVADVATAYRAVARWISLDTAYETGKENDYTACGVYDLLPDYRLAKRDAWRERVEMPDLLQRIEQTAQRWNYDQKLQGIVIEDKGSGKSALQTLRAASPEWLARLLAGYNPGQQKKEERWRTASVWCARGRVLLPEPHEQAPWLFEFENELFRVPSTAHDDQADEFAQAILYLEHFLSAGWQAQIRSMIHADRQ